MTDAMNTVSLIIPGCAERGTVERSASAVMSAIDVADYFRIGGDAKRAREAVNYLRRGGKLQGLRVGREVVYAFEEVTACLRRLKDENPA